jgi:hypothetical protein
MACVDDTLTAAAAILQNLAREAPSSGSPSFDFNFSPHSTNGVDTKIPKLPGDPSLAKVAFENELEALVRRIHRLEIQTVSSPSTSGFTPVLAIALLTSFRSSNRITQQHTLINEENLRTMRPRKSSRKVTWRRVTKMKMDPRLD